MHSELEENNSESDVKMEDVTVVRARRPGFAPFHTTMRAAMAIPGRGRRETPCTRAILQSFISSQKSDVFKCQSNDVNAFLNPPYACSYTQGAKGGGVPILAVATEQGTVHLINTSKRRDWDAEPPRTTLQIHDNGIFDAKWNTDDTSLATCSGDQTTRISCPTTETVTHVLRGHKSTVKCVAWDPSHRELLSTGGRDGTICIWDLRVAGVKDDDSPSSLGPVISMPGVHEDAKVKGRRRGKSVPTPRSITSLLYPNIGPYGLISSGSFDGILKYWDLRLPANHRGSKSLIRKPPANLHSSPIDPTTLHGSHRSRGIIRLAAGTGATAGLIFGLGADSRIHTYSLPSLEAMQTVYVHENMQTNSFYVGMSLSPVWSLACHWQRWKWDRQTRKCVPFRCRDAARPWLPTQDGVQLRGQQGEVGAVDWADDVLASCADDGTVRVWRPDIENYRMCVERPEASRWDWSWAV
ncbi:WD40 repeat-like protein [Lyophyllum atratum]|nr:WD40 repeat-like protein [Lyophyllum atratum]